MKPPENDCSQLPLCEGPPTDDVANEGERRDDVAVLTSENGIAASRCLSGKRALYLVQPRLSKLKFNCRWRQGAVLGLGVFLTVVALTLVVVGAVRSREHTPVKLLHIKQPVDLKSLMYLGDENFTFAQLVSITNLAIDKPAYQSSVSKRDTAKPEVEPWQAKNAVDGNIGTCSSTGLERAPSWYVDLLGEKTVRSIRIQGSNFNKLHDVDIYVSQSSNYTAGEDLCGRLDGVAQTLDVRLPCASPKQGRYIILELQTKADTYESLVLCEVMVFQ